MVEKTVNFDMEKLFFIFCLNKSRKGNNNKSNFDSKTRYFAWCIANLSLWVDYTSFKKGFQDFSSAALRNYCYINILLCGLFGFITANSNVKEFKKKVL